MSSYMPDRGDLVWLEFAPQAGGERRGRRPASVISPKSCNSKVGLALVFSLTSNIKGYPFEAKLPDGYAMGGVVLSDQLKSLD
ncbi:MAG: type II toxin-antitoxin system PemK/MazF family toxin [Cyanobacteriota bacterium]|nr:type II toxin-antitoxin system PemK/MazF family toxin [Cyanobacteriota bacterium]